MKFFQKNTLDPLPKISTPYDTALKRQQKTWFISIVLGLLMVGFYSWFYVQHRVNSQDLVPVMVAINDLQAPALLVKDNFKEVMMPKALVPVRTFKETNMPDLVDQTIQQNLVAYQVLLPHHLQADLNPDSISAAFDTDFVLSVGEDWFVSKFPNLKAQDRIDILVSNPRSNLDATTTLVRNLKVIEISKLSGKKHLTLNTTEEEARGLLFARSLKLPMQILVHSAILTPPAQ